MNHRVTIRMTADMSARIDAWIAAQTGHVSRQEAVRRLVDLALDAPLGLPEGRSTEMDRQSAAGAPSLISEAR